MFEDAIWVKYPVKVVLFEKFNNRLKITTRQGKVLTETIQTNDGVIISKYFRLRNDKNNIKIPAPDMPSYQNIEGIRELMLLKLNRNTFWPINDDGGNLFVNVPHIVFETEINEAKETVFKLDESKQPIPVIETIFDIDENGTPKVDKKGNKIILKQGPKIQYEKRIFYNSKVRAENGEVMDLPALVTNENEDWETWHAMELEKAQRKYRSKNWWQNNATLIITIVGCMIMFLLFYYGVQKFAEISAGNNAALTQNTNNIIEVMKNMGGNSAAAKPPM